MVNEKIKNFTLSKIPNHFRIRDILFLMLIILLFISIIVMMYFSTTKFCSLLEEKDVLKDIEQTKKILLSEAKEVSLIVQEYAVWNDTYLKVGEEETDAEWFQSTFSDWLSEKYDIQLIAIFNKDKELITKMGIDDNNITSFLDNDTIQNMQHETYYKESLDITGFYVYGNDLYLLGISQIVDNQLLKPSNGILMLGKKIDSEFLNNIQERYGYNIFITTDNQFISNDQLSYLDIATEQKEVGNVLIGKGAVSLTGRFPLEDIFNQHLGYINVINQRETYIQTKGFVRKNMISGITILFIILAVIIVYIKTIIINPLKKLENQITEITNTKTLNHVNVKGFKEIESLANSFNNMTSSLQEQKTENISLKKISNTDYLTSLYNHRYFYEVINKKQKEDHKTISLIFGDIDRFKYVNDTLGHKVGDEYLKNCARIMKELVPEEADVFRFGGEEFIILLCDYKVDEAYKIAEKIRNGILNDKPSKSFNNYLPPTISFGIASYPEHALDVYTLIDKADKTLYFSKRNGRNQSNIYGEKIEAMHDTNSTNMLEDFFLDSALALAQAIDAKDTYTGKHSHIISKYALLLSERVGFTNDQRYKLKVGSLLHDCGKIGIPDQLINKREPLTDEEYNTIKRHTVLGYDIVKYITDDDDIIACVRSHHERYDGGGYPDGIKGEKIPLFARIVCIADAFHAMISDRPYRTGLSEQEALKEIEINLGTQFDPELGKLFIKLVESDAECPTA